MQQILHQCWKMRTIFQSTYFPSLFFSPFFRQAFLIGAIMISNQRDNFFENLYGSFCTNKHKLFSMVLIKLGSYATLFAPYSQ